MSKHKKQPAVKGHLFSKRAEIDRIMDNDAYDAAHPSLVVTINGNPSKETQQALAECAVAASKQFTRPGSPGAGKEGLDKPKH